MRNTLVVEAHYDQVSGGRFRHGTGFLRWRPDKPPAQCVPDQLNSAQFRTLAKRPLKGQIGAAYGSAKT